MSSLEGVKNVDVDFDSKTATVTMEKGKSLTQAQVKEKLGDMLTSFAKK